MNLPMCKPFFEFVLEITPFHTFGEYGDETDVWSGICVLRVQSIFFATGFMACALPWTSSEVDSMLVLGSEINNGKS